MNNKIVSRCEALRIIKLHGWEADAQTMCFNGMTVKNGSSFNELEGIKEVYLLRDVLRWLGY